MARWAAPTAACYHCRHRQQQPPSARAGWIRAWPWSWTLASWERWSRGVYRSLFQLMLPCVRFQSPFNPFTPGRRPHSRTPSFASSTDYAVAKWAGALGHPLPVSPRGAWQLRAPWRSTGRGLVRSAGCPRSIRRRSEPCAAAPRSSGEPGRGRDRSCACTADVHAAQARQPRGPGRPVGPHRAPYAFRGGWVGYRPRCARPRGRVHSPRARVRRLRAAGAR